VAVEIKFCGMTRPEDAVEAASLGAAYIGVIFAGGPRAVSAERAREILSGVPDAVRRVGVFANQDASEIRRVVETAGLDVVQLHGATDDARIVEIRSAVRAEIWSVVRVSGRLPADARALIDAADGLLLDAYAPNALGGTGISFAWEAVAADLQSIRGQRPIILAGGLRPENVAEAIAVLAPDIVDVSSGVESSPGIKDHERMRAFRDAVMHASIST
jgi:phosphoribosylanthranilate isomerase